ncbi:hypothetical protein ACFQY0_11685 [Haloferula chungangensis]|uniref:Uncharacterized protein n=1 Tax=Haloferula chungangensis TaxID=1048331 RepID=A0ABW2L8P3_9BACT
MGPDLADKRWIIAKGVLFLILALFSAALQLLAELPTWQEAVLLLICVWSACRFYYFLFHVLHAYVGIPRAGILDLLRYLWERR